MHIPTLTTVATLMSSYATVPVGDDFYVRSLSSFGFASFDVVALLEELAEMFDLDEMPPILDYNPTVRQLYAAYLRAATSLSIH